VTGQRSFSAFSAFPAPLDARAYHGPIGEVVDALAPETEADPVAILVNLLTMFGNAVGAGPHVPIGGDIHTARLFAAVVGETARARKGTASSLARKVMVEVDPEWSSRILSGFGSGEAVVDAVRDATEDDPGAGDHRLLVREGEFARILKVAERDGSTLSPIIRDAWDGSRLAVRTRKSTIVASGAHVSVLGDITLDELRHSLSRIETANGFANRFLWTLVRRSRKLPSGGRVDDAMIRRLVRPLRDALAEARRVGATNRTTEAEVLWQQLYELIPDEIGLVGAITARAEAHLLRLSLTYALTEGSCVVDVEHLLAATALWDYCVSSAAAIFGPVHTGDPVADRLLDALRKAGGDGLDGTAINQLFAGHASAARLNQARTLLEERGVVITVPQPTGGRPRSITFLAEEAEKAEKGPTPLLRQLSPFLRQARGPNAA
jgi:hypothetical protein